MEFLISALVLLIGGYIGWHYYQAKTKTSSHYILPESVEVKVDSVAVATVEVGDVSLNEAEKRVGAVKEKVAKTPKKKAPAKKKPNMKIAK